MNLYNLLLEKLLLPAGDLILGTNYIRHLREWRRIAGLSSEELQNLQKERLREILVNATKNVPYYRSYNRSESVDTENWLNDFPILTKEILREHKNELFALPKKKLIRSSSSGSSGVQSVVFVTKDEKSQHQAIQTLWWEWAGFSMGKDKLVQTGMGTKRGFVKKIKDILFKTEYLFAFSFEKKEIKKLFKNIEGRNNVVLGGYASSLNVLAELAIELGIKNVSFKCAISWGDKLFSHYRKAIGKAFRTSVYETYGTAEGLMIAAQKDLDYLYLMTPAVYIELLDDFGNPVEDGEMGQVVVTSLIAKAFPLIRFKIGDLAIRLPIREYPDRRELNFPLLKKVIGRDTDLVRTRSGKTIIVHSFTGIFEHISQIRQFCIIQESLAGIIIQYIPDQDFTPDVLEIIRRQILAFLKEPFTIIFEKVDSIPPTPSGKPQIIISKLK